MCMAQPCPTCSKTTWRGCGQHIPQVMDSIAQDQRCTCVPKTVVNGVKYPPMQGAGKAAEDGAKIEVGYGA